VPGCLRRDDRRVDVLELRVPVRMLCTFIRQAIVLARGRSGFPRKNWFY
jgi:hypothetical protein